MVENHLAKYWTHQRGSQIGRLGQRQDLIFRTKNQWLPIRTLVRWKLDLLLNANVQRYLLFFFKGNEEARSRRTVMTYFSFLFHKSWFWHSWGPEHLPLRLCRKVLNSTVESKPLNLRQIQGLSRGSSAVGAVVAPFLWAPCWLSKTIVALAQSRSECRLDLQMLRSFAKRCCSVWFIHTTVLSNKRPFKPNGDYWLGSTNNHLEKNRV